MTDCFLFGVTGQSPLTYTSCGQFKLLKPFFTLFIYTFGYASGYLHSVEFKFANEGAGVKGGWRKVPNPVMWKRELWGDSHANP